MATQTFDDGSTLITDVYGTVIGGTDINGTPFVGRALASADGVIEYGARRLIDKLFGTPSVTAATVLPATRPASSVNVSNLIAFGAIVIGAVILFKTLAK